jgi:hypothetical protein
MGRFAELCGDVAAEADAGPDGLVLPQEALERLRESGWVDGDIEDALEFVHATFVQDELIEAADSLSGQLVELLGALDDDARFAEAAAGRARLSLDAIRGLTRRVVRLERVLAPLREGSAVDSTGVERLGRRLADEGIAVGEPRRYPPSQR